MKGDERKINTHEPEIFPPFRLISTNRLESIQRQKIILHSIQLNLFGFKKKIIYFRKLIKKFINTKERKEEKIKMTF